LEHDKAHKIARDSHEGQRSRFGDPMIGHVERVAAAVPPHARATALLHDVLEHDPALRERLGSHGIEQVELEALELLTRAADEGYEAYVGRIADAPGAAGSLARVVKLADLDDHLDHVPLPADAPPYAWARERLLAAEAGSAPG